MSRGIVGFYPSRGNKLINMQRRVSALLLIFNTLLIIATANGQDSSKYTLRLRLPLYDFPQQNELPHAYPSMNQSLILSSDLFDLGFWGISGLSRKIINPKTKKRKFFNALLNYGTGYAFSKYGSSLPIPLGEWAHEEFHRSVLGVNSVASKNGMWIFNRWDGTVYGVSDNELTDLKQNHLSELLYSYVAGVQSENLTTKYNVIEDVYHKRTFYKNPLYLYNAIYVYNYFKFSTGSASDSVKVLGPRHEDRNPSKRDFAGSDLTAWAYDMFNPNQPFKARDSFPNGEGVNRRIGFSDLSIEAQKFLEKQMNLSMLNFINPAIFCINRIKVSQSFAFNFFTQYNPTHFGNALSLIVPFNVKGNNWLVSLHNFNNRTKSYYGVDLGYYDFTPFTNKKVTLSAMVYSWIQPTDFYSEKGKIGGALEIIGQYKLTRNFSSYINVICKSKGWLLGNPYLNENVSVRLGVVYNLKKG